jgi:hypothetical protein
MLAADLGSSFYIVANPGCRCNASPYHHAWQQHGLLESVMFLTPAMLLLLSSGVVWCGVGPAAEHTHGLGTKYCNHLQDELDQLQSRFNWQAEELHRVRTKCLPGR